MKKNNTFCCSYSLLLLCPDRVAEYCDEHVCLCVCLSVCKHISGNTCVIFPKFFVLVTYGCGSVLLWRHCDKLCTSGFMDAVILTHKPRQLNVATQLMEAQPTCKQRIGIPVLGQWTQTHWTIFRVMRSGPTRPQWAFRLSNIHDIMFAHNVPAYIAAQK